MTQEQYFNEIEKVREKIRNKESDTALSTLDALFQVKPVRLKWIVAKAEVMLQLDDPLEEITAFLKNAASNLYDYPDLKEFYGVYFKIAEKCMDNEEMMRHKLMIDRLGDYHHTLNIKGLFNSWREAFLYSKSTEHTTDLFSSYYQMDDRIMYFMFHLYLKKTGMDIRCRNEYMDFTNSGFLMEVMTQRFEIPIILMGDSEEINENLKVLLKTLEQSERQIYWISQPIEILVDQEIKIEDTVTVSMNNIEIHKNVTVLHPVEIILSGESLGDNRDFLLKHLSQKEIKSDLALIFTSGVLLDELCAQKPLQRNLNRMTDFTAPGNEEYMAFGLLGNYTAWMDIIHCTSTKQLLEREAECDFSIVIPARNSAKSLRHTLKTCLNQRFQGSYEIVLSDNSSYGNNEIYQLYREINSPIIKYYRTPREYSLSKSFEYAFLQARGEFILSIGSDDGVFPWSLEVLSVLRKEYPQEEIIKWDRGFYAWPGFHSGEHQFIIPGKYNKDDIKLSYVNGESALLKALEKPQYIYALPMLYINSGFKRSYLKTLLDKTGSLWDGVSQDTYIGVINCLIKTRYLRLIYPITVAGMTAKSAGAQSTKAIENVEEDKKFNREIELTGNIGGFIMSKPERLLPMIPRDIILIYDSVLRAFSKGVISEDYMNSLIDWKKVYTEAACGVYKSDLEYDRKLHCCRYSASLHGEIFLEWFDKEIYTKKTLCCYEECKAETADKNNTYREGELTGGGQVYNASKYGVTNIYEATLLFEKLTGL